MIRKTNNGATAAAAIVVLAMVMPVASRAATPEGAFLHGLRVAPDGTAGLRLVGDASAAKSGDTMRPVPASLATLLAGEIAGFDKSTLTTVPLGSWACLSPPGSAVRNALAPLIAWRQRQGYQVIAATTDEIGGNDSDLIKAWLQDLYDTLTVPLEMVCLVGDADGAVAVDTWREDVSGLYGEGDHFYTQLDGDDIVGDVHLGRLSVTSVAELATVVGKIVAYESDPWLGNDPTWFTRAGLVADVTESGWSTIFSSRWVKQHLLRLNYTAIDTIFGGNYTALQMASLNAGKSLYTYRGHWQMSGLTTGHIASLTNGRKLPFVVTLTCDTGSFWTDTTCRSEAFLRAPNGGGIAAIGTATTGTHTRYNDCMFQGIIDHALLSGDPRLGPALSRGKLHMFANYWTAEPDPVRIWSVWNNLMGDPATALWTAVPRQLTVTAPTLIGATTNALPVGVTAADEPVAGAIVAAVTAGGVRAVGTTGADGRVVLPLPTLTDGVMQLTVTGFNLRPWLGNVTIGAQAVTLRPLVPLIDDDNLGFSRGDGDGAAEPGETIELRIPLINDGSVEAGGVSAVLQRGPAPGVLILRPRIEYGAIAAGQTRTGFEPYVVVLTASTRGGSLVPLTLDVSTISGSSAGLVDLTVSGPGATLGAVSLTGSAAPGGTADLGIELTNSGDRATAAITAALHSRDRWVSADTTPVVLPGAPPGSKSFSVTDAFSLSVDPDCPAGHLAVLDLDLTFAEGGTALLEVPITCGQAAAEDPCGPDTYGYYAFDDLDAGYAQAPVYDWVEIDPALGGAGTSLGLTDFALYGDQTVTIDMPFPFRYYGTEFTRLSVCSNGWLSFGATPVVYYRNWRTPTPGAADNMVCAFWDELMLATDEGGVFTWYDEVRHRLVVEWSRLRNGVDGSLETFETILHDPAWRAGETGDGEILLQYRTVNQVDTVNGYATVGIQNAARDDGVLYSYWNLAAPGGAPVQAERAVLFTTLINRRLGPSGDPVPGAVTTLVQNRPNPFNPRTRIGFTLAEAGAIELGVYDLEGRLLRQLARGAFTAGPHEVNWQGDDERGGAVASGTYFYRLRTVAGDWTRKMTLLR